MRNLLLILMLAAAAASAGEPPGTIPQAELQALDRAISRELNSGQLGSQTLGDLRRLKHRLMQMQATAKTERQTALEPPGGDDAPQKQLQRLEAEALVGGRAARRALAFYHLYLNDPEKALAQWRAMGQATDADLPYLIGSAYLELALGEYNAGRGNLEKALRLMDTRTSLALSTPVFCTSIAGYRLYLAREGADVLPGEDVLIYVEVEGAEFTVLPDGDSECRLMFGLTLRNDVQNTVWAESNYGEYAPAFAGPVRDLHTALTWRVPNDLQPGRYHLFIDAVEGLTRRRGESVLAFNVGRRETNPEKRPTGAGTGLPDYGGGANRMLQDAAKNFPGAPTMYLPPDDLKNRGDYQFEILRNYEQMQRGER